MLLTTFMTFSALLPSAVSFMMVFTAISVIYRYQDTARQHRAYQKQSYHSDQKCFFHFHRSVVSKISRINERPTVLLILNIATNVPENTVRTDGAST
jgi:hypothetical protein